MKCLTPPSTAAFDQGARLGGVVEVIAERIADRFRHDDLGGEMGDRVDFVLVDQPRRPVGVAEIADHQLGAVGHRPGEPGRQIVEDDDVLARVQEAERHMAADVAGAAGHQNAHRGSHPFVVAFDRSGRRDPARASQRACTAASVAIASSRASRSRRRETSRKDRFLDEQAHPQGRPAGRRPRHALSAGDQGDARRRC